MGDGRAKHVLQERFPRPGVEPAGARGGMKREAVEACAERLVEGHRLAGERHKLGFLAPELGSGGRRLPGRGRRAERRVALRRRRLNVVVVVGDVVGDVAVVRPAQKPAPCEIASDAAHRALENSPDLACRQVRERVKDDLLALLLIDPVEKENVQVWIEPQIRACTL